MIDFTPDELELIRRVENGELSPAWDDDNLETLKSKIKKYRLEEIKHICCYCQRDLTDEFVYDIDIEHILPKSKSKYPKYMLSPINLSVSCKRCNMEKKGEDTEFLTESFHEAGNHFKSSSYLIVHPNLDAIHDHIIKIGLQVGARRLTYYHKPTEKGKYTHDYFDLGDIERRSLDESAGKHTLAISDSIPQPFREELLVLIRDITS